MMFDQTKILALRSTHAVVWMAARPPYCDRGRVLVHVHPIRPIRFDLDLDAADCFPRYYFDLDRAKAEIGDWLAAKKETVQQDWTLVDAMEFNPVVFGRTD